MDKKGMRRQIRTRLLELGPESLAVKSQRICSHVMDTTEFGDASVVMVYLAVPREADLASVILHAWQRGKTVAAPKIDWNQRHMLPVEIRSLESGHYRTKSGLRNPRSGVPVPLEDIDLVLAPGMAFDTTGARLGRGGAYYDRFLAAPQLRATVFGVGFSEQMVGVVPMEEHDRRVHGVITDAGIIRCRRQGGQTSG